MLEFYENKDKIILGKNKIQLAHILVSTKKKYEINNNGI